MKSICTNKKNKGQTLLEYSIVIGLVAAIIVSMGSMIGRSTNTYIKFVADEIGMQNEAEQNFDGAHLEYSYSTQRADASKERVETPGFVNYVFDDAISGTTNSRTNLGVN